MIAFALIALPLSVSAWFFMSAQAQSVPNTLPVSAKNSQTMALLTSSVGMTSDLRPNQDIDIAIEDNQALAVAMGSSGTLADLVDIPIVDTISLYTVEPGDTVALVAKRFSVSENTIRWGNNLSKTDVLHVGQKLTILPITGVRHPVAKGDTLATIAKRYKADLGEIASYNGLETSDALVVGSIVIVPDGEVTAVPTVSVAKKVSIKGTGVSSGSASITTGYYIRPVKGIKTQGFHDRYNAVDVGAPIGTQIVAMADGTVISSKPQGWNGGYGGLVIIQHSNGTQTLYAHQSKVVVTTGQQVSQGQKIGEVGSTGRSTGPHLHFEIRGAKKTPVLY